MKFALSIDDRVRVVQVHRQAGGFRVEIDGQPRLVDAVRAGDTWSLIVRETPDGPARSAEAIVLAQKGNGFVVHVNGQPIEVVQSTGFGRRTRGVAGAEGAGPQRLLAPMPGKVVKVLVAPGDEVRARQGLIVVEAMKMENELRAARPGRVREVFVSEGQSVEAGTALVVVE